MPVWTSNGQVGFARNLTLVLMLFASLAGAAIAEGYAPHLSPLFIGMLAVGFVLALLLSIRIPMARLLALLTLVFFMEYANQTIGIASGLWQYHGIDGQYVFGVMSWMVAACSAQTLSTMVAIPLLQRLRLRTPRGLTTVLVLALLALIPLLAGDYAAKMGLAFWVFFGLVSIIALIAAQRMPIQVFLGVVLAGWFVGFLSEYGGSVSSGCWTFPFNPDYPPFYLVLGCWPLEILVQFSVSAFLAGEPLVDKAWTLAPAPHVQAVAPATANTSSAQCDDDTARWNRHLCLFLVASSLMYLVAGFAFAIMPNRILSWINALSAWLVPTWPRPQLPEDRFWVSLSFSMMMTITALCVIGAATVRRNKSYALVVMIAKLASTLSSLVYFLIFHHMASLVIVIVDGSLFLLTGWLVFRALKAFFHQQTGFCYARLKPYPSTGKAATVVVCQGGKDDAKKCLDEVLDKTGFFDLLEKRLAETHKTRDSFSVVIKPNFMFAHSKDDPSTFTDPALVEYLADQIAKRGFGNITLVEAQSTYGNYYTNREVRKVAAYVGYHLDQYKLVDLTKEMVPHDYGGRLGKHFIGPTWRDADFRISFAKNKTHIFCNYTLTLKNVYGTLPMQDKLRHYHTKREIDWPTIETLKPFPVHFGLVDAYVSADGQFGVIADPNPKHTNTIFGGDNLIAVDWVGAKKMGLDPDDPLTGRFLPLAMNQLGKPEQIHCNDLSIYPKWKNVSRIFIYSLDLFEEAYDFGNWWFSVLTAQASYFTFMKKDWPTLLVRKLLAPFKRMLFPHDTM